MCTPCWHFTRAHPLSLNLNVRICFHEIHAALLRPKKLKWIVCTVHICSLKNENTFIVGALWIFRGFATGQCPLAAGSDECSSIINIKQYFVFYLIQPIRRIIKNCMFWLQKKIQNINLFFYGLKLPP